MNQITPVAECNPLPFQPLGNAHNLDFLPQACLGVQFGRQVCAECETVCPVQVIRLEQHALTLGGECLGCGRCAAVCPTAALQARDFDASVSVPQKAVTLDCWKVPAQDSPPDSLRIPCLGGLSKTAILTLLLAAQGQPVRLLDRGWCHGCTAGGGHVHPASAVIKTVSHLLAKRGVPAACWPHILSAPLVAKQMPAVIPSPLTQQTLGRRGFFKALLSKTTDAVVPGPVIPDRVEATARGMDQAHPAGYAAAQNAALIMQLAQRVGSTPDASWFPSVVLESACCDHGICAGVCPGGALRRYEDGSSSGMQFDPMLCLACGLCEQVCPEHAARLLPEGNQNHPLQIVRLNQFIQAACQACGKKFSKTPQRLICGACEKHRQMGQSLFGAKYAADKL